jgi:hypothetical protein
MEPTCGKSWTRGFLVAHFTQAFLNKPYKAHREKLFFDKEQALLPATQLVIERRNEKQVLQDQRGLCYKKVLALDRQRKELSSVIQHLCSALGTSSYYGNAMIQDRARAIMDREVKRLRDTQVPLHNDWEEEQQRLLQFDILLENVDNKKGPVKRFLRKCGDGGCRGFLGENWQCGLCAKETCDQCLVTLDGEKKLHVCDPDEVATAKLLATDSKPCPQCATFIFKIDGCDQMWCTQCHVAFSWRTGAVETRIHNPHYFEWMRQRGTIERNPNDVECGRDLDRAFIEQIFSILRKFPDYKSFTKKIEMALRWAIHIRQVDIPRFAVEGAINNEALRIRYMDSDIDEPKFRALVLQAHTKYEKNKGIHDILTMFCQCITDILFRIRDAALAVEKKRLVFKSTKTAVDISPMESLAAEIDALLVFVNGELEQLSKDFHSVQHYIHFPERNEHGVYALMTKKKEVKKRATKTAATEVATEAAATEVATEAAATEVATEEEPIYVE